MCKVNRCSKCIGLDLGAQFYSDTRVLTRIILHSMEDNIFVGQDFDYGQWGAIGCPD